MKLISFALTAAAVCFVLPKAGAHPRRFAYNYDVLTMPKGGVEFEQWATWKHYDQRERFEFRSELELGLTDHDQLSFYLSDWRHTDNDEGADETEWRTAGVSWVHNFTDPTTAPLGVATYLETLLGPEKFVLEGKLLLQKNIGAWSFVYNGVLEAEWEGADYGEEMGVIENIAGISYQVAPSFSVGVEALHEVEFEGWSDAGDHVVYAGPNVAWRSGDFSAVLAGLWQATDVEGEPDFQLRVIAAIDF
jgi:hypothetical protein